MTSEPRLSIITVCRDHASGLRRTLRSYQGLDFDCIETIVIDGSLGDDCASVVAAFPGVVTHYLHGRDRSIYHAMNKGMECARGTAFLFVNAGDEILDTRRISQLVRDYGADMAHTIYFGGYVQAIGPYFLAARAHAVTAQTIAEGIFPSHQAIILPAGLSRAHPYDEALHFLSDVKFLKRAFSELPHIKLDDLLVIEEHGGISSSPGSFPSVLRHCCEAMTLERPLYATVRFIARVLARKIFATLLGRRRLEAIQIKRALRRAVTESAGECRNLDRAAKKSKPDCDSRRWLGKKVRQYSDVFPTHKRWRRSPRGRHAPAASGISP